MEHYLDCFIKFVTALRSTNSRLDKEDILRNFWQESLRYGWGLDKLFHYVYDYDKQYYLTSANILKKDLTEKGLLLNKKYDILWDLLDDLSNRVITGHNAIIAVQQFLKQETKDRQELILNVIDKDLKCGLSEVTINKVCGNIIPQFKVALAQKLDKEVLDESYICSRKLDGCFTYNAPVLLSDGTTKPIGEIVENKLSVDVLSYNIETKTIESKKIINWFDNGIKNNWLKIKNKGNRIKARITNKNNNFMVTTNHKFFNGKDYTEAKYIDKIYSPILSVNKTQEQILLGSLLGDGCISHEKRSKKGIQARISFSNSVKQEDYFYKKYNCCLPIMGKVSKLISGFGSSMLRVSTNTLPFLNNLYKNNNLDYILSKLNVLGLAIWYLDDGSRAKDRTEINTTNKYSRAKLSTYAFSYEENKQLSDWLNNKGYDTKIFEDKRGKGYWIDFRSEGSQKFFKDIAPYVPISMEYKLPTYLRGGNKIEWWKDNYKQLDLMEDNIIKTSSNRHYRAYDIEVADNHNYFVSGMLVHNCRLITICKNKDDIKFFSRQGKEFDTLNILKKDIENLVEIGVISDNTVLDGEICITDENGKEDFQSVMKEIKRKDHTIQNPMYIMFDLLTLDEFNKGTSNKGYRERLNYLQTIYNDLSLIKNKHLRVVEHFDYTPEEFKKWQQKVIDNGWEGLIARKNVPYENKRSKNMLKIKSFQDEEFKVIGVEEGDAQELINGVMHKIKCVGSLIIEYKGNKVNVGTGLSLQQRKRWYEHPEEIIGSTITVKFFEPTQNQDGSWSLRFPVLKAVYEGERDL